MSYKQARGILRPSPGDPSVEEQIRRGRGDCMEALTQDEWRDVIQLLKSVLAMSESVGLTGTANSWSSWVSRERIWRILEKAEAQMRQAAIFGEEQ